MDTVKFWILVGTIFLLITWLAIIDISQRDFGSMQKKLIWGFVVFIPFFGCVAYFAFGRGKGKRKNDSAEIPQSSD